MSYSKNFFIISFCLFVIIVLSYRSIIFADFVWDDKFLVFENPLLRAPLWSFEIFRQDIACSNFSNTIYYRPIQILSYALDYRLWAISPAGYHLTNILFHFINALLVYYFSLKISKNKIAAAIAGTIFVSHPLNSGVVSYISSRADILLFMFTLAACLSFVFYKEKKCAFWVPVLFIIFSIFSKEAGIVTPILIFFMDIVLYYREEKINWRFHSCGMGIMFLYFISHRYFFSSRYNTILNGQNYFVFFRDYIGILSEFFRSFVLNIHEKFLIRRVIEENTRVFMPAVFFAVCGLLFFYLKNNRRLIMFAFVFFLTALFPMAFVVKYFNVYGEHWMYLANYGVILIAALFLSRIYAVLNFNVIGKYAGIIIFSAGIIFYSFFTHWNTIYWRSEETLNKHVQSISPSDNVAMYYSAVGLAASGKNEDALALGEKYTNKNPNEARAWYIKARLELASGNVESAELDCEKAIELNPLYDDGYIGLAFCAFKKNDEKKAEEYFKKALTINSKNIEALLWLARIHAEKNDNETTIAILEKAKKISPYKYDVILNLGTAYSRASRNRDAAREYMSAIKYYPEKAMPYYNLGRIFYDSDYKKYAKEYLGKAVKKDPFFMPAVELYAELMKK
ncbi:Tetratricopeptide TPR_2 repeat protein [Candidatus Omnitrophus magneticus]|uniref:Tetratricopeptide TPR_2 repeat protein n=1 Tax=Candidatus Omnitrophus magneticus TaxID=1609969 RepID=A0A0F0CTI5_9BACT|nr:Tetratricopeptide TPR_2 repeat protein [Candidatus Omnitrophus magneticus]